MKGEVEQVARLASEALGFTPEDDVRVERWSPGDGMTRYRLVRGGDNITSYFLGRRAFVDFCRGVIDASYARERARRERGAA